MLDDILNESFEVEIDGRKYNFEFDHLAYATLEKETGKSIYWFYDELISGKNLMYTDLLCLVNVALLKHHSKKEIDEVLVFFEGAVYKIQDIINDLIMAFIKPLMAPVVISNLKKKLLIKTKNKKLKN